MKKNDLSKLLSENAYPGRGILIGRSTDGKYAVTAYFIMSFFFSGGNVCVIIWAAILMVMCIARHHANIDRLIHGTENKLGNRVR